jgi:flagellar basal-body rod modification protein FlgD
MTTSILDLAAPQEIAMPTTLTRTGSSALGKDEFIKLLVAQLANQDPTKPQDSTAFVAQLAQFSALEEQQNTNGRLDSLLLGQATATQTSAATFIGKDVTFKGGDVHLVAGQSSAVTVNLQSAADKVSLSVTDGSGRVVRTLQLGAHDPGSFDAAWDGRDDQGNVMPDGTYTVSPVASSATTASIPIDVATRGTVTGVSFQDGVPLLKIGAAQVKMSDITSIDTPPAAPNMGAATLSAIQLYQPSTGG